MLFEHAVGEHERQVEEGEIFVEIAAQVNAVADALELIALDLVDDRHAHFRARRRFFAADAARFACRAHALAEAFFDLDGLDAHFVRGLGGSSCDGSWISSVTVSSAGASDAAAVLGVEGLVFRALR